MWKARNIWNIGDLSTLTLLRELRAVCPSLTRSFADFISHSHTKRTILHQDNMEVINAINAVKSLSPEMTLELQQLQEALAALNVHSDAKWSPAAVNRFVNYLWRTWDPDVTHVSQHILSATAEQYRHGAHSFCDHPLDKPRIAQLKAVRSKMQKWWGRRNGSVMASSIRSASHSSLLGSYRERDGPY